MNLTRKLVALLGPQAVRDDEPTRAAHAGDKWMERHLPEVVVFPETTAQVAAVLRFANRHGIAVTPRGAGCGQVGGCVPVQGGIALSVMRMNRIRLVSAADFVAVTEPGVITARLQAAARRKGLLYPPDPASLGESSIGGNIATNAGGPRCLKYGVTRHYVLGLEVVLADGSVLRTGARTHKNKTGLDLTGLFTGSEGTLGVITEATLRLIPLPPARAAFSAGFDTFAQVARAVQRIFAAGFLPAAVEISDAYTLAAARRYTGGGALVPAGQASLLVEIDGQAESVRSELRALAALVRGLGARQLRTALGDLQCEEIWALRRVFSQSLKATGLAKLNEDVVVPRGRLGSLVAFCERLSRRTGHPIACFGHAGDGNIHVNLMAADYFTDATVRRRVRRALDELFDQVLRWGGVITGEHGIGLAKLPWWQRATTPQCRATHLAIKRALDPRGILNPGKFV